MTSVAIRSWPSASHPALQRRGYDVTVKDVFEAPTVASLAATRGDGRGRGFC